MKRRQLMQGLGAVPALAGLGLLAGCASTGNRSSNRYSGRGAQVVVVVVGGGFGGATAAKYIRMWSDYRINVTLVEPAASLVSCPMSNLVLGGSRSMADITLFYDSLVRLHGVRLVQDSANRIDNRRRALQLAGGTELPYDRLVLSPGVDFMWNNLAGMESAGAQDKVLHAWKAGPQTVALRRQLEAMPDGGVYALSVPLAPYRCPPGPYERACQVANYFSRSKPRSKVLILDANADVTSKGALFKKAWAERYPDIIEYHPNHQAVGVDAASNTLVFDFNEDVQAHVLNVIPPMRAGDIAVRSGLATANQRWCEVDFLSFESLAEKNIHVLGDAIQTATGMPKSGHMANQHGKTCAAAIVALLGDQQPNPLPLYNNTCYSFVNDSEAMHVASVHQYDAQLKTMLPVAGAGGTSQAPNDQEGRYANAWAQGIWADMLA